MWGEVGRGESKNSKLISVPPCDTGLKSHPILTPPSLWGGENLRGVKWGGTDQAGQGKITIPTSYS